MARDDPRIKSGDGDALADHRQRVERRRRLLWETFLLKSLYRKSELWHGDPSLDERRPTRRRKAVASASRGGPKG